MITTVTLAKFFGIFLTVMGAAILFREAHVKAAVRELRNSSFAQLIAGIIPVVVGSAVLSIHSVWGARMDCIVTTLGYIFLVGGLVRIFLTDMWLGMIDRVIDSNLFKVSGAVVLLVGIYLLMLAS